MTNEQLVNTIRQAKGTIIFALPASISDDEITLTVQKAGLVNELNSLDPEAEASYRFEQIEPATDMLAALHLLSVIR